MSGFLPEAWTSAVESCTATEVISLAILRDPHISSEGATGPSLGLHLTWPTSHPPGGISMAWLYPWNLRVRPVLHSVDGMLNILQRVIAATHRIEPRLCVLKRIQERGVSQPFIPLQGPSSGLSTSTSDRLGMLIAQNPLRWHRPTWGSLCGCGVSGCLEQSLA